MPVGQPRSISAGGAVSCAILDEGSLWCWGLTTFKGIGAPVSAPYVAAVRVGQDTDWVEVAVDYSHTCARKQDNSLWCWGTNSLGALGQPDQLDRIEPVRVPGADWTALSLGPGTCGLHTDGRLTCYGLPIVDPGVEAEPLPGKTFTALASPSTDSSIGCALDDASLVWCWGNDDMGSYVGAWQATTEPWQAIANDDYSLLGVRADGGLWVQSALYGGAQTRLSDQTGWTRVSGSEYSGCATRGTELWCWGDNTFGQHGDGRNPSMSRGTTAELVDASHEHTQLSGDTRHICVNRDDTLMCAGYGALGGLGDGLPRWSRTATVAGSWSSLDADNNVVVGLADDDSVQAWGTFGVQGINQSGAGASGPVVLAPQAIAAAATAGGALFIRPDGTLWVWGTDMFNAFHAIPQQVDAATTWRQIDGSRTQACGIRSDGTLWCWGVNGYGEVGIGGSTPQMTPTQIGTASWLSVSAGDGTTCGLQSDSSLWCWGSNPGSPNGASSSTPRRVDNATWSSVAAGSSYSCGLRGATDLWCWGTFASAPAAVDAMAWSSVDAGWTHHCGVQTDGSVWCWGYDDYGDVDGDDTAGSYAAPIRSGTATDVAEVATPASATCTRATDGTVECFGNPEQIGGGLAFSSTFVPVVR